MRWVLNKRCARVKANLERGTFLFTLTLPPLFFCPLLKISLGNPYLKHFVVDAPIKKEIVLPPSEHFEIWVQKPPVAERVKSYCRCQQTS